MAALYVRKAEQQPFPDVGVCFDYDYSGRRSKKYEVPASETFAGADKTVGAFFLFHEGERQLHERIAGTVDSRKVAVRAEVLRLLEHLHQVQPFRVESDGRKGHPFESLVALHYLEKAIQATGPSTYKLEPIQKLWGTTYASQHQWVNGEPLRNFEPYTPMYEGVRSVLYHERVAGLSSLSVDELKKKLVGAQRDLDQLNEFKTIGMFIDYLLKKIEEIDVPAVLELGLLRPSITEISASYVLQGGRATQQWYRDDIARCIIAQRVQPLPEQIKQVVPMETLSGYRPSGLCAGRYRPDVKPRNIIVKNSDQIACEDAIPAVSIIDQYWLGEEEARDKKTREDCSRSSLSRGSASSDFSSRSR